MLIQWQALYTTHQMNQQFHPRHWRPGEKPMLLAQSQADEMTRILRRRILAQNQSLPHKVRIRISELQGQYHKKEKRTREKIMNGDWNNIQKSLCWFPKARISSNSNNARIWTYVIKNVNLLYPFSVRKKKNRIYFLRFLSLPIKIKFKLIPFFSLPQIKPISGFNEDKVIKRWKDEQIEIINL